MSSDTSQLQDAPRAPVLKRKGFQFCDGVFSINGVCRVDGPRLYQLFNPSTLEDEYDQDKAFVEARQLFKKSFFAAQLKYYGIPFQSSLPSARLSALLKGAVQLGKCNRVPEAVIELEATLRAEYAPLQRKWRADCAAWSTEKKQREDDAFEKCKTPGERAACDINRFMEMYFLTNGKPDKVKTTTFLMLGDFSDDDTLRQKARKIPGLEVLTGSPALGGELWIGWEGAEWLEWEGASDSAGHISALEREEFEREEEWEQLLETYQKSASSKKKDDTKEKQPDSSNSDPRLGSYVIQCPSIMETWSDFPDGPRFTMDVFRGKGDTLIAAYYFGVIEGTMIICESGDTLSAMIDEVETDSETSESEEVGGWEEVEGDEVEEPKGPSVQQSTGGKKRKAGKVSSTKAIALDNAAKRRKTTASKPSFPCNHEIRLRGRDTGTYEILPDPEPGHLDILGDDCAKIEGVIYKHTLVGNDVRFEGRKVSDTPQREPEPWKELGYKAHRREEVARW
ncbi:hypothetical protein BBK36DRAFT_1117592 [Trichoderma citrinoviride]|uniref:Uncharacterized protein n=1 Tax=Trichoderma citrinoviride TaxID=58853 RepID=A0A2T4BCG5_9HYPO|nr:hypothetical protein BBK36DRAFT_1117592 [Trichoderma citrinoviride]PTB66931.1 hypothetical protein BBK36DRAFT_1117592 [Trichoderma citrinoviride]